MKSLLILTPRFPYPVIGGDRLRIYYICKALSKYYCLTLLSLCETRMELSMPIPDDGIFSDIQRIYHPKWRSWLNCVLSLPGKEPLQVAYFRNQEFQDKAQELLKRHDAVLAHLIRSGNAIKDVPGVKFLEMTDAISLNYERIKKAGDNKPNDLRAFIFGFEAQRLRHYEEEIVDNFAASFLVSEIDRSYLFSEHTKRLQCVHVCSNGVDLEVLPYQFRSDAKDISFIGNMNSLQNFDAAFYMASEVLPLVRKEKPDTRLRLIGRIPLAKSIQLSKLDGVDVTGEVKSVALAAVNCALGVCPLRLGAGVQNKILEYMALGLPTVSTSIGLEGFHAIVGRDLIIADETDRFATEIISLLKDREFAEQIAINGRQYVEKNHSWEAKLQLLISEIELQLASSKK